MANESKSILAQKGEVIPARQGDGDRSLRQTRERPDYAPQADIIETSDEFLLIADLPGVDDRSVEINLDKNILNISAHPQVETPQGYTLHYAEYTPGDFERRFVLSELIARDRIEASMKNGVLTLRLPKAGAARAHKISVKGS